MTDRLVKLQLLARMNRGKLAIPPFLAALSDALSEPIEPGALVSLLETDLLMAEFRAGYLATPTDTALSYRRFFLSREEESVYRLAGCLADRLPDEDAFFLTKLSEICGAVGVRVSTLLRHAESIIQLDGDSVSVISKDRQQGLLIDRNPDDRDRAYEIAVWGDRWPLLI